MPEGTPLHTDRSARNVPLVIGGIKVGRTEHTQEVTDDVYTLHTPDPAGQNGKVPMSDNTKYVMTDVPTQTEFDSHAADPAANHAPVTVVDTGTIDLSLVGQEVSAALKDTLVVPGSYTRANITVDAQGRITAASNGILAGRYRQLMYSVVGGNLVFLTDSDGQPLFRLCDLEV